MASAEFYDSHSCLLDDLMEQHIIKCDIDFGSSVFTDELAEGHFNSKASPSHGSDSGCSDISEDIRSVSPLVNDHESPFLDFDPFECDSTEQALDSELEMYFAAPVEQHSSVKKSVGKENMHTPVVVDEAAYSDPEASIGGESSDEDYIPPNEKAKSTQVIHTPQSRKRKVDSYTSYGPNIHIAPQPATTSTINRGVTRTPAIKVVKVIKTPAVSKKEIDDSIFEALDERNKKNAVQAKMNREKKKAYIKSLEEEIGELKTENYMLKETNKKAERERASLENEVEYLRSVLANDSALSGLLKNINHAQNVKLSSTFCQKRGADLDHDYQAAKKLKVGADEPEGDNVDVSQTEVWVPCHMTATSRGVVVALPDKARQASRDFKFEIRWEKNLVALKKWREGGRSLK